MKEVLTFAIFMSLFYLIGFGLLGYGLWNVRRSAQAAAWPTTPATLQHLELKEDRSSKGTTFRVQVKYKYSVDGNDHQGECLAFGYMGSKRRNDHEQIYQRLRDAREVAVRYDPFNPSDSCLTHGVHKSIQFVLAFAASWLLFVSGFVVMFWLQHRDHPILQNNLLVR